MALENGWPGHSLQPTFSNIRHDQEGMIARNIAGKIRAGVLPSHTDNLVVPHADGLRVTIKDNRAVLDKDGAVFISNTGDLVWPPQGQSVIKWPDPPLANKRIDLLYLRQRSSSLGDGAGNDTPTFGVHSGTAAPIPTVPSLPPALADALVYAKVEMPAGASSMTSGPVVENVFPFTAMAGGTVVVRSLADLATWTPADGAKAYCLADSREYLRRAGVWVGVSTIANLASAALASNSWSVFASAASWNVVEGLQVSPWNNGIVIPAAGIYEITGSILIGANIPIIYAAKLNSTAANGTGVVAAGQTTGFSAETRISFARTLPLQAGDVITPAAFTSATAGPYGITPGGTHIAVTRVG